MGKFAAQKVSEDHCSSVPIRSRDCGLKQADLIEDLLPEVAMKRMVLATVLALLLSMAFNGLSYTPHYKLTPQP